MDLALGLLDLHDLAELGRLRGLALADCFGVGSKMRSTLSGKCVSPWRMRARACAPTRRTHLGALKGVTFSVGDRQGGRAVRVDDPAAGGIGAGTGRPPLPRRSGGRWVVHHQTLRGAWLRD